MGGMPGGANNMMSFPYHSRTYDGHGQPVCAQAAQPADHAGMIFGVGAVVAMLSITGGAQKEMMSFIDQLGVNNIIVEAQRSGGPQRTADGARDFAGLSFRDFRAIQENVSGLVAITPRKRSSRRKLLPKTNQERRS
jgi:hypothetical protein